MVDVEPAPGVEHHEPIAGIEGRDRGDGLDVEHTVEQLLGLAMVDRRDGMVLVYEISLTLPMAVGQLADRAHDPDPRTSAQASASSSNPSAVVAKATMFRARSSSPVSTWRVARRGPCTATQT